MRNEKLSGSEWKSYLKVRARQRKMDEFAERHPFIFALCQLAGAVVIFGAMSLLMFI